MNRKIMIVGFILMAIGLLVLSNAVGLMTVTYTEPDDDVGVPDGSFLINGKVASSNSDITVSDGTMTFKFVPSQHPKNIDRTYIEVWYEGSKINTIELVNSTNGWLGSYELPEAGYYGLSGYIVSLSGSSYAKLNSTMCFDDGSNYVPVDPYGDDYSDDTDDTNGSDNEIIGFMILTTGAIVAAIGVRRKR